MEICGRRGMSAEEASSPTVLGPGAANPCGLQGIMLLKKIGHRDYHGLSYSMNHRNSSEPTVKNGHFWFLTIAQSGISSKDRGDFMGATDTRRQTGQRTRAVRTHLLES